jgi:hypothetical protein
LSAEGRNELVGTLTSLQTAQPLQLNQQILAHWLQ